MKWYWMAAIGFGFCLNAAFAEDKATDKKTTQQQGKSAAGKATLLNLTTLKQKASYAIGINIGRSLSTDGYDVDLQALARGLADALRNAKPLLTDAELRGAVQAFTRQVEAKTDGRRNTSREKNKKAGQDFLAKNAQKKGVKTLKSGLQYEVLKSGKGRSPKATDRVKTHYHGTLIDGTVFDSSVDRGEPIVFAVNGVIKGWTEALQRMKVGDKWRLFVPAKLAYGDRGAGGKIGPGATLIFEVELLGIE